jgi:hypothetical protein
MTIHSVTGRCRVRVAGADFWVWLMSRFSYRECNPYTIEGHPDLTPQDLFVLGLTEHFCVRWNPDPPEVKPPAWAEMVDRAKAFITDWDARQHVYTQDELTELITAYREGSR